MRTGRHLGGQSLRLLRALLDARLRGRPLLLSHLVIRRRRFMNVECHVCNNADVIDTSHMWELQPESIMSLLGSYLLPAWKLAQDRSAPGPVSNLRAGEHVEPENRNTSVVDHL